VSSRRSRVSGFFALITQYTAVVRYPFGRVRNHSQACILDRNIRSWAGSSFAWCRCSYE